MSDLALIVITAGFFNQQNAEANVDVFTGAAIANHVLRCVLRREGIQPKVREGYQFEFMNNIHGFVPQSCRLRRIRCVPHELEFPVKRPAALGG